MPFSLQKIILKKCHHSQRGAAGTIGTLFILGILLGGGILANVFFEEGTQYFSKAQTPIESPNCYFQVGQATGFRAGVPTQITAVASMDASQTAGDLGLEVFLDDFRRLQFQSFPGHTGTIQFNWTPTDADAQNVDPATGLSGFHNLRCRAWNDAKAECRPPALVVPGGLQYACAGNGNNQGELGIRVLPATGTTVPPLTCAVTMQGPPYSGGSTYQLTADIQGGGGAYSYNWSVIDGVNNTLPFGTVANATSQTGLWTAPTTAPNGSTGIIRLNVTDTAGNATQCSASGQVYQPTPVTKTWSFTFDAQCADGTILNLTQLPQTWYWFDAPTTQNPQGTAQPLTINGNDTSTYVLLTQPDVTQLPLTPLIFPPQMSLDTTNPNRLTWAGSNLPAGTYNITMTAPASACTGAGGTGQCTDTETGESPYVGGITTLDTTSNPDTCSGNTLLEYRCNSSTSMDNISFVCPGACVSDPAGDYCEAMACTVSTTAQNIDPSVTSYTFNVGATAGTAPVTYNWTASYDNGGNSAQFSAFNTTSHVAGTSRTWSPVTVSIPSGAASVDVSVEALDANGQTATCSVSVPTLGGGGIGPLICDYQTPGATCDPLSLVRDILVLFSVHLGYTTLPPVHNADVNNDTFVNIADIEYIVTNYKVEFIRANEVIQYRQ